MALSLKDLKKGRAANPSPSSAALTRRMIRPWEDPNQFFDNSSSPSSERDVIPGRTSSDAPQAQSPHKKVRTK